MSLLTLTSSYTLIKVAASLQKHQKHKPHDMTTFLIINTNMVDHKNSSAQTFRRSETILPCRPGSVDTPSPTRPAGSESRRPAAAYGWFSGKWETSWTASGRGDVRRVFTTRLVELWANVLLWQVMTRSSNKIMSKDKDDHEYLMYKAWQWIWVVAVRL